MIGAKKNFVRLLVGCAAFLHLWVIPISAEDLPETGSDAARPPALTEPFTTAVPDEAAPSPPAPEADTLQKIPTPAAPAKASLPTDPQGLLRSAGEFLKQGRNTEALETYTKVWEKPQTDPRFGAAAVSGAARAAYAAGDHAVALDLVRKAVILHATLKNAMARSLDYMLMGRILMAREEYEEAVKSFDEGLKILPSSQSSEIPKALEDTAQCRLRMRMPNEAVQGFSKAAGMYIKVGATLDAGRVYTRLGELLMNRKDPKGAAAAFRKAEKIYREMGMDRELVDTLYRVGMVERLFGDINAARKAFEEARSAEKGDSDAPLPLMVKGMFAHDEGKTGIALKFLSDSMARFEKTGDKLGSAHVKLLLAEVELDSTRNEAALTPAGGALADFRALGDAHGEAGALELIGRVHFRQAAAKKALEYAQEAAAKAKAAGSGDLAVAALSLISEIHIALGDPESATKALKEAVDEAKRDGGKRTKARLKLTLAQFRFSRESVDKAFHDATEARKDFAELQLPRGIADCDHLLGLIHEVRGEKQEAARALKAALEGHVALGDRYGEGRDLTAMGVHLKNAGETDAAMEHFEKSLDMRKGVGDLRGCAANLVNIGNILRQKGRVNEAQQSLEQALAIYREVSDKGGEADTLANIAHIDAAMGQKPAAREKFTIALKLHREVQDYRGIAVDLTGLGRIHLAVGDLQKALEVLEEAEKQNKRIRNVRGEVAVLSELAMTHRAKGAPAKALELMEAAGEAAKALNDERTAVSLKLKTAALFEDAGEFSKAAALLSGTLPGLRAQGDKLGELFALSSLGILQVKMEDYEPGLTNLREALRLRAELGPAASGSRDPDYYIGEIYEGFRDNERALDHYRKALENSDPSTADPFTARIYEKMAEICYRMEEFGKAREYLEDAIRIYSELRDAKKQKTLLVRLGDTLSKLGDAESALKYQHRALTLVREAHDDRAECRILSRIGTLYQMLGKPKTALEYYRESRDKRLHLGDKRGVNENLLQIALVNANLGDFEEASAELRKAFEISHCSEDRGMLWKAYFIMGRVLEGKNRPGEALEAYRKAGASLENMEADIIEESDEDDFIFGGKAALFDTTLRVLMRLAGRDPGGSYDSQALRIVEKLKAAEFENTLTRINVDHFSDLPPELPVKEKSLKLALRKLNARISEELSKVNPDQALLKKLQQERLAKEKSFSALKEKLMKEYPAYADLRYPQPTSIHQLQKHGIEPEEAILEYMVTRSKTYIFAIDKQRFYTYSVDYPAKDLDRDVETLTRPLRRADMLTAWDPSAAWRVYTRLIQPIEAFLIGKKTLVVIPHGPLCRLPFEILTDSKAHSGKRFWSPTDRPSFLVEKYAFCYAPSLSALSRLRAHDSKAKPGWNFAGFGDALYVEADKSRDMNPGAERILAAWTDLPRGKQGETELKPLAGGRKEIIDIVKTVGEPAQTYFGSEATETLFKKVDLSRYAYIHLATHCATIGGYGADKKQPALVFSLYGDQENDGFLQMGEVFGLKLNADLVGVSGTAAASGQDTGESSGFYGLARAFLFAGADSVIMGALPTSQEHSARLFHDMYRNLRDGSKAEALRKAKLNMIAKQATSHPAYWASYILIGNSAVKHHPEVNAPIQADEPLKGMSVWKKLLNM